MKPVNFDNGVIGIDTHVVLVPRSSPSYRGLVANVGQQQGGDGVALADVSEGERPEARSQSRGGVPMVIVKRLKEVLGW